MMKRQWSEEEKIKIVKSYEVSGLSSQNYADREGLAFSSLRRWIGLYGEEEKKRSDLGQKQESLSFVELLGTAPEPVRRASESWGCNCYDSMIRFLYFYISIES